MSVFAESSALYSDIFVLPPFPFCLSLSFTMLKSSLIHTLKAEKEKKKTAAFASSDLFFRRFSKQSSSLQPAVLFFFFFFLYLSAFSFPQTSGTLSQQFIELVLFFFFFLLSAQPCARTHTLFLVRVDDS